MKLLTRVKLNFIQLREVEFRHHFNDAINPMCIWGADIDTSCVVNINLFNR